MINEILGLPSGQLISVTKRESVVLMNLGFIDYNREHEKFTFNDNYLSEIQRFTKRFYVQELVVTGTGKDGVIVKVIDNYDGGEVNGKNISNIFSVGDTLYVVKFSDNKIGVYSEEQLKKVRKESINENHQTVIDIIGFPSGQVIEVHDNELAYLKGYGLVRWNGSRKGIENFIGYVFNDDNVKEIMEKLYELY